MPLKRRDSIKREFSLGSFFHRSVFLPAASLDPRVHDLLARFFTFFLPDERSPLRVKRVSYLAVLYLLD